MAFKTVLEKRICESFRREKFLFAFNTILLSSVIGDTLQPKELSVPSTAGMVKWVCEGVNTELLGLMEPQWYVDTCDAAMLYVASLTTPGTEHLLHDSGHRGFRTTSDILSVPLADLQSRV